MTVRAGRAALSLIAAYGAASYAGGAAGAADVLSGAMAADAPVRLAHPFPAMNGAEAWRKTALGPLDRAFSTYERRETIRIAGVDAAGALWVGTAGDYAGVFAEPFLDIPPTGHLASMRFHEFFRIEDGRIAEVQALWDLPELMMHAGVWPMSPSLGREWRVPGPATQDGLKIAEAQNGDETAASLDLVGRMLADLGKFASGGVDAMRLEAHWHPRFSWYGPSGIGSAQGVDGFRRWHQAPFLAAMPDRSAELGQGHFFAQDAYVGFTAWPGMRATLSGDGWLGIAPSGRAITLRSLDFWRCEAGMIRENWVLVDLLDIYAQLGVDVLARMRQLASAGRSPKAADAGRVDR